MAEKQQPGPSHLKTESDDAYTLTQQQLIEQQQLLFQQYQTNLIAKKQQGENQRGSSYNKALFTLSYLVSLQLRKSMEVLNQFATMRLTDLQDVEIMKQKQQQLQSSMTKFKKHFGQNYSRLAIKERQKQVTPKFSVCFVDLASFLNVSLPKLNSGQDAEAPDEKDQYSVHSSSFGITTSQLDRNPPSVIQEEKEEQDADDDSTTNLKLRTINSQKQDQYQNVQQNMKNSKIRPAPRKQKSQHIKDENLPNAKISPAEPISNKSQKGLHSRKVSINSENEKSSNSKYNGSLVSIGYSEISQVFNLQFKSGRQRDENSSIRSSSIHNYGHKTDPIQESANEGIVDLQLGKELNSGSHTGDTRECFDPVPNQTKAPFNREITKFHGCSGTTGSSLPGRSSSPPKTAGGAFRGTIDSRNLGPFEVQDFNPLQTSNSRSKSWAKGTNLRGKLPKSIEQNANRNSIQHGGQNKMQINQRYANKDLMSLGQSRQKNYDSIKTSFNYAKQNEAGSNQFDTLSAQDYKFDSALQKMENHKIKVQDNDFSVNQVALAVNEPHVGSTKYKHNEDLNTIQLNHEAYRNVYRSMNFKGQMPSLNPYEGQQQRQAPRHNGRAKSPLSLLPSSRDEVIRSSTKSRDQPRGQKHLLKPLATNILPSPIQAEFYMQRRKEAPLQPFSKQYLAVAGEYDTRVKLNSKKVSCNLKRLLPTDLKQITQEIDSVRQQNIQNSSLTTKRTHRK